MKVTLTFCVIMMVIVSTLVLGQKSRLAKDKITGIYTDMHYNDEGGDVLGEELFVVYSSNGYYVIFQSSEGVPEVPILAKAKIEGNAIQFSLQQDGQTETFTGKVTNWGITGQFDSGRVNWRGEELFRLQRKKSYWQ